MMCDPTRAAATLDTMIQYKMSMETTNPFRVCSPQWGKNPEYVRGYGSTIEEAVSDCLRNLYANTSKD